MDLVHAIYIFLNKCRIFNFETELDRENSQTFYKENPKTAVANKIPSQHCLVISIKILKWGIVKK